MSRPSFLLWQAVWPRGVAVCRGVSATGYLRARYEPACWPEVDDGGGSGVERRFSNQ
jgi:hypothetical protein